MVITDKALWEGDITAVADELCESHDWYADLMGTRELRDRAEAELLRRIGGLKNKPEYMACLRIQARRR